MKYIEIHIFSWPLKLSILELYKNPALVSRKLSNHENIQSITSNHDDYNVTYSKSMTNNKTGETVVWL